MKKKVLLYVVLLAIIGFITLNIFTAGDKHVEVVEDNITLTNENSQLKTENNQLKSENSQLKSENQQLNSQISTLSIAKKEAETILPKTIIKIEKEVEDNMGWTFPEQAYDLLKEKLKRKPTDEEYKKTLIELIQKDLLYHPGVPDPYMKGKKVSNSEVDKVVRQK